MEGWVSTIFCKQCANRFLQLYRHNVRSLHQQQVSHMKTRNKMSAWHIHGYGANDQLTLSTSSRIPTIHNPEDILIEVHAASINPIDVKMRGGYGEKLLNLLRNKDGLNLNFSEFPLTLGRDFSGVVMETGREVQKFKPGDEVWGVLNASRHGSHAEFTVSSHKEIAIKPNNLSHIEAASIPYVALTNWSALHSVGELTSQNTRGKRILVLAGAGGIGNFAIQLMKSWGGEVTTTCSTDAVELVTRLGADHVIDYKTQNVTEALGSLDLFDLILDPLGGTTSEGYMKFLRTWHNSKLICIAHPFLNNVGNYGLIRGFMKSAGDLGFSVLKGAKDGRSYRWALFSPSAKGLRETGRLVESGQIQPVVEKVYDFEELPAAFQKVEDGHARGKVVIKVK